MTIKLFASEEPIFRFGEGLERDRITTGARVMLGRKVQADLYYLGDQPRFRSTAERTGYAVLQLTLIVWRANPEPLRPAWIMRQAP